MNCSIRVEELFQAQAETLGLEWIAACAAGDHRIASGMVQKPSLALVGELDFVYPSRLQVFGRAEIAYLNKMTLETRYRALHDLFGKGLSAMIVSDQGDQELPAELSTIAEAEEIPLFRSTLSSPQLVHHLHHYLSRVLAKRTTIHGVFLDVMGVGTFLTGPSGVGKSEVALELITRGHHLIADDAPEFAAEAPGTLVGRSPEMLKGYLEVRGLGLLNIRQLFGSATLVASKQLHLIIHFKRIREEDLAHIDPLQQEEDALEILRVPIPRVILPVTPGRNLAIMVEVAVQHFLQKTSGAESEQDFREHLDKQLSQDEWGREWN